MSVDRYTKFVLTVIAACLIWIAIRPLITVPPLRADQNYGRVVDVNIVEFVGERLNTLEHGRPALPVRIRD